MVIFMGYFYDHRNRRPTFCDDVWAYSLEQSTWALLAKAQGPSARYGHVVAIDPPSDRVIVHGGDIGRSNTKADTSHLADAWVFSLSSNTWTALSYNTQGDQGAPSPRSLHTGALLEHEETKYLVVHGGLGVSDTWVLNLETMQWKEHTQLSVAPGERHGATMVVSPVDATTGMQFHHVLTVPAANTQTNSTVVTGENN
eukprot:m.248462 g.248462  ORF g.248462 m.248462 type:complete len:199 (+) comp15415_c1_seq9:158-754(+)